jgi:glycosyltransferase involved in cell wall biosynthesis
MSKKQILFISYLYPPAGGIVLPGSQRTAKFVRNIKSLDVTVLAPNPEYYPDFIRQDHKDHLPIREENIIYTDVFDVFSFFLAIKNKLRFSSSNNEPEVDMTDTGKSIEETNDTIIQDQKRSLFQRLKDIVSGVLTYPDFANHWIYPAIKEGRKIVKEQEVDYIFATGKPWSALIVAYFVSKKCSPNVKLVVDFRDPWVNNPFAVNESRVQKLVDKYLEKKVVQEATLVLLNTDPLTREFVERYPQISPQKFITMPNGFDANDFTSIVPEKNDTDTCKSELLTITHAGRIYGLRDPISIFKAIASLRRESEDVSQQIQVRQLGEIDLGYDFPGYIRENCDAVNFMDYGQMPYVECIKHLNKSDILLIIQPDTKTQVPSKLYEYIYLNKPILTIAPKNGALGEMIERYEFGEIFEPDDIEGISGFLVSKVAEKRQNGYLRNEYKHRHLFDVKQITAKLENLLAEL